MGQFKSTRHRFWQSCGLFCSVILLLSCAQPPSRIYPPSCETKCVQKYKSCAQVCYDHCSACKERAFTKTKERYFRYVRTQRAQGIPVAREFLSYRDPLGCMKVTCDCSADYVLCKQVCHKQVKPILQEQFCSYPMPAIDFE